MKRIYGLDNFQITERKLFMQKRKVKLRLDLNTYQVSPAVVSQRPSKRHSFLQSRYASGLKRLQFKFPDAEFGTEWGVAPPSVILVGLPAASIPKLLKDRLVHSITVVEIPGVRRKRRSQNSYYWYCVQALIAIEIEKARKGIQTVENRFILVKAHSPQDAVRRIAKQWREYAEPYLNSDGYLVRWQFQKVVDIFDTYESEIDPSGTEVYSKLSGRRMRPQYIWNPGKN